MLEAGDAHGQAIAGINQKPGGNGLQMLMNGEHGGLWKQI